MNEPTPKSLTDQIILLWLSGLTIQEINEKTFVSTGRISEITREYQQQVPDADTVRAFCKRLREHDPNLQTNVPYTLRALSTQKRLDDLGVSQELLNAALQLIQSQGPEEAEAKIRAGIRIADLEAETGMTCNALIAKASDARTLLSKKEALVAELESKAAALLQRIRELEKIEVLQQRLEENGIDSIDKVVNFLQLHSELELNGFTSHVARNLASVLASIGLTPQEAAAELASLLAGGMDLRASVAFLRGESNRVQKENARQAEENAELERQEQQLREQKKKISLKVSELFDQAKSQQEEISYSKAFDILMNDPSAIKDDQLAEIVNHLDNARTQRHQGNVKIADLELKLAKSLLLKYVVRLLKDDLAAREEVSALEQKYAKLELEKESVDAENSVLRTRASNAEGSRDTALETAETVFASLFPSDGRRALCGYRCPNLGVDVGISIDEKRMRSLIRRGFFHIDCRCNERHKITVADLFRFLLENEGALARVAP